MKLRSSEKRGLFGDVTRIDRNRPAIEQARASLAKVLAPFFQHEAERLAAAITAARDASEKLAKAAEDDVDPELVQRILDALDLSSWDELVPELRAVLVRIAIDGVSVGFDQIAATPDHEITDQANQDAINYAAERAAELVGKRVLEDGTLVDHPDAEWAITESTRDLLRAAVTRAVEDGTGTVELTQELRQDYAFSEARAETIARTELAMADVQGNLAAYRRSGQVRGKEVVLSSDHDGPDECDDAAALGVVPLEDDFGGAGDPPFHPRCKCDVLPVLDEKV